MLHIADGLFWIILLDLVSSQWSLKQKGEAEEDSVEEMTTKDSHREMQGY